MGDKETDGGVASFFFLERGGGGGYGLSPKRASAILAVVNA